MRLCGGIDWSREGNSLRGLFVTVSELWLSLIGSIKTRGCIFKDKQKGNGEGRERDGGQGEQMRDRGRAGEERVTVARLCSAAGERTSPLGSWQWTDCACACCKFASVWEGGEDRQWDHKTVINGVCLTVCVSPIPSEWKPNQWRLFRKKHSVTSVAWWWMMDAPLHQHK